jgi:hypothetical protein
VTVVRVPQERSQHGDGDALRLTRRLRAVSGERTAVSHWLKLQDNRICVVLFQELRNCFRVQLTSPYPEAAGRCFCQSKEVIRQRDRGLHGYSLTEVIPVDGCGTSAVLIASAIFS